MKLIPTLVAVAGAAALVPLGSSYVIENRLNAAVQHLNGVDPSISMTVLDYERGYLSSAATTKTVLDLEGLLLPVTMHHSISSLPSLKGSLGAIETTFEFDTMPEKMKTDILRGQSPLTVISAISIFGRDTHTYSTLAIDHTEGRNSLQVSKGEGVVTVNGHRMVGDFTLPSITGFFAGTNLSMKDLRAQSDVVYEDWESWVWTGTASTHIGQVAMQENGEHMSVSDIGFDFESMPGKQTGLVDAHTQAAVGKISVAVRQLGAPVELDGITFESTIENLDAKAYRTLTELGYQNDLNPGNPMIEQQGLHQIRVLLKHKPVVRLDNFEIRKGDNRFTLAGGAAYVGDDDSTLDDHSFFELSSPADFAMDASAKVPKALLFEIAQAIFGLQAGDVLSGMRRQGVITVEGDVVTSKAVLTKGRLMVNGKDMTAEILGS